VGNVEESRKKTHIQKISGGVVFMIVLFFCVIVAHELASA
jgi:hypothetical protein